MPKTKTDYSKTVIYKIVCRDESIDYLYVGSTTNFTKRKCEHKLNSMNPNSIQYNQKKYIEMRKNGGWDNFIMLEIEKFPCNDKNEAFAREEEYRKKLNANMNMIKAHLTVEERKEQKHELYKLYYDKKHKEISEKKKLYKQLNKETINKKNNEQYTCECGGKYTHTNKTKHEKTKKHKEYFLINKIIIP